MGNLWGPSWKGKLERGEPLPPDLELTEELLRKMGVAKDEAAAVLGSLQQHKRKTWGALLVLLEEGQERVKMETGDEVSAKVIWRFLESRVQWLTLERVHRKRPLPSVEDTEDDHGVRKFMRSSVLKPLPLKEVLALAPGTSLQDRMISLGMELNDKKGAPQWVLFRECFGQYFEQFIGPALAEDRNVFIGGAQGIGKSVFTDLLALLLTQEGEVVLLEHFDERLLLVGDNPNPKAIEVVKAVLAKSLIYDPDSVSTSKAAVYVIKGDDFFNDLVKADHLIVIQDLGSTQGKTVTFDGRTTKIWISSPNAEKLKPLRGDTITQLCVPPVTIEEMLQIRERWNPNGYTEKQVRQRYATYGGSVRLVLQFSEAAADDAVDAAIVEATTDTLRAAFSATLLNLPKGSMSGLLVHPIPRLNDPTRLRRRFASDEIGRRLFNKFVSNEKRAIAVFLQVARAQPELRAFAGYVLEHNMHDRFMRGITVTAKPLRARANVEEQQEIVLPRLDIKAPFNEEDFTDIRLEDLVENAYFQPASPTFPTIDSFAILPLSVFVPDAEGVCLTSLQSTVSRSHVTAGYILERLFKHVAKKWPKIRRFHVFVTGPNGIRTKQKVDMEKVEGGSYAKGDEPNVEQWAMTLGDEFDELFKSLEAAENSKPEY